MTLEKCWRSIVATFLASTVVVLGQPTVGQDAWRPARELLPAATQGMIELVDVPEVREKWSGTQLGRLLADPEMEPFEEELRRAIDRQLQSEGMELGVSLGDLLEVTTGEMVVAWIEATGERRPYRMCMLADVRGNGEAASALLQQLDQEQQRQGARRTAQTVAGAEAVVLTRPQQTGQLGIREVAYALDRGRLILASRAETLGQLLRASAAAEPPAESLVTTSDYRAVDAELESAGTPDIRWFARPLGMARIFRELADVRREQRIDVVELLENQGFDAIRAVGGRFLLAIDPYDVMHRVFVYAPPVTGGEERYRLAARMLQFPNQELQAPPDWIPQSVASFMSLNWKMETAFWATETLVNEAVGDEIFRDTLEGIREDPDGPQIDLARDVVGNFGERLMLVTDNTQPVEPTSDRTMLAIELTDAETVRAVVRKAMRSDPNAGRVDYPDHEIWEIRQEDALAVADAADLEDLGFGSDAGFGPAEEEEEEPLLESWAITVYDGYLLFSSHAEMLVEIIDRQQRGAAGPGLKNHDEYQRVVRHIQELGGQEPMVYRVVFPDVAWRARYELLRRGELRESDSLLANLIRRALDDEDEPGEPLEVEGQKLPPYQQVEPHLTPTGGFAETHENGWIGTGFILAE